MAGAREIRTQIRSIQNTQKITRAMEMVAASKMRRAQDRMEASRPYAERIHNVIGRLALAHPEYVHPYMEEREAKRAGFLVVTTDRGLCGGLNVNLFRRTLGVLKEWDERGVETDLAVYGTKGIGFFRRIGANLVAQKSPVGDAPLLSDLVGPLKVMIDAYNEGTIDRVFLAYNRFVNTMTQQPIVEQLLPLVPIEDPELQHPWDYLYEPSAPEVLGQLLDRYVESLLYQGVVENISCEMAARMVAMKSASDNAGKLIDELQLVYNKARQAAITTELSEIVAGAAAV